MLRRFYGSLQVIWLIAKHPLTFYRFLRQGYEDSKKKEPNYVGTGYITEEEKRDIQLYLQSRIETPSSDNKHIRPN